MGYNDHEVRILIQPSRKENVEEEERKEKSPSPVQTYNCRECGFKTPRVDVIMMHKKSHLSKSLPPKRVSQEPVKKSPAKKVRKSMSSLPKTKTKTIDEDIALLEKGLSIFEDKVEEKKEKKERKKKEVRESPKSTSENKETILNSILCEWDNDVEEDEDEIKKEKPAAVEAEKKPEEETSVSKPADNSCFDFSEEEEQEVVATASGRKIPRVIPDVKEKTGEEKPEETTQDEKKEEEPEKEQKEQSNDNEFMELMETTSVPKIPEVPSLLKCEQNFHDDATIKFPDKPESSDSSKSSSPTKEVATKLTNPKKRFVKSFEDFAAKYLQQQYDTDSGGPASKSSVNEPKATTNESQNKKKSSNEGKEAVSKNVELKAAKSSVSSEKIPENTDSVGKKDGSVTSEDNSSAESSCSSAESEKQLSSNQEEKNLESDKKSSKQSKSPLKSPEPKVESDSEKSKKSPLKLRRSPLITSPTRRNKSIEETQTTSEAATKQAPEKSFFSKKPVDDLKIKEKNRESLVKEQDKKDDETATLKAAISKTISESLKGSSLKHFFKLPDEEKVETPSDDGKGMLEVSKLKTQLMSKLSNKDESTRKPPKRSFEEAIGAVDLQVNISERVLPKYNKGRYRSRIYQSSEGNSSGLHVAKKRAVTSFEDFLEKKPEKPKEKTVEVEEKVAHQKQDDKSDKKEEKPDTDKKELEDSSKKSSEPVVTAAQQEEKPATVQETPPKGEELKAEKTTDQEAISEEVPMELETEILQTTSFETTTTTTTQMDMSALSTLAAVSELSPTLDPVTKHKPPDEAELVPLDKNVTVVSEKDLADGQVEFAKDSVVKPLTLSSFSMDFSDSNSESSSNVIKDVQTSSAEESKTDSAKLSLNSEVVVDTKKEEKNVIVEKQIVKIPQQDLSNFDIEEQIPPSIVSAQSVNTEIQIPKTVENTVVVKPEVIAQTSTSTKLAEILNDRQKKKETAVGELKKEIKSKIVSISPKGLIRQPPAKKLVPEKKTVVETVSVQKISSKMDYEDIEEIDKFIIQKKPPSTEPEIEIVKPAVKKVASKPASGKAKILQQTIITPTGDIIHPEPPQSQQQQQQQQLDDNVMFDINSMPIVLGDQILQPENTEGLPVVISDTPAVTKTMTEKPVVIKKTTQAPQQMKILNKGVAKSPATQTYIKVHPSQITTTGMQTQKVYQVGSKVAKPCLKVVSHPGSREKFILLPPNTTPTGIKTGVEKRVAVAKKMPAASPKQQVIATKVQNIAPEPTGNKILVFTNQQGQRSRVLLTPEQQKMFNSKSSRINMKTTVVKSGMVKSTLSPAAAATTPTTAGSSNIVSKVVTSAGQLLTTPFTKQLTSVQKTRKPTLPGQRQVLHNVKASPSTAKHPATVVRQSTKKIQSVDDEELLEQQVQEQLQAIRASSGLLKSQPIKPEPKPTPLKQPARRSYVKKQPTPDAKQTKPVPVKQSTKSDVVPPLAPISPKKAETPAPPQPETSTTTPKTDVPQRPLNQLIIQDAQGNQTTITEGQILALPSETVDGQPSTYMLVTLDETGNLTPLNNEALMSLDPNLGLGGDLSNMVLQLDAGNATLQPQQQQQATVPVVQPKPKETSVVSTVVTPSPQQQVLVAEKSEKKETVVKSVETTVVPQEPVVEPTQQFYVADPVTAQKLIESLTESNADIASLLANVDMNSVLINADGQQILINANTENQVLLTVNADSTPETTSNPVFAPQPTKSQDILAAALADTDVFQQDHTQVSKVPPQAQLSPNNALYPMNVSNVLETSLTLTSPIMTPLEVPSTNTKKVSDDVADILTQVPKNVDLPITITDPNISQTVAHQQVASLIANELQELPLAISDGSIVVATTELNSPSYGYSLPSLDDINQKSFSSSSISMPLLTEDTGMKTDDSDQSLDKSTPKVEDDKSIETKLNKKSRKRSTSTSSSDSDMITEGLCTLGGEMCSSLSEPPPDMFDLAVVTTPFMTGTLKPEDIPGRSVNTLENSDLSTKKGEFPYGNCRNESGGGGDTISTLNVDENSCEIPLQPDLTTKTLDSNDDGGLKRDADEGIGNDRKRIKTD